MGKKKLISLVIAIIVLFSAIIPVGSAFADTAIKYHPDDWFGYTHSKEEIDSWIAEAVKCPTTSEEAVKALTGEIRPGDILSFQVEVEMPTGHEEVIQFLKDFSFNMILPFGANAMIEVYASDAPLLTDEAYNQKISEFNNQIDEFAEAINDEELLQEIETDEELKGLYFTYKDMVDNRDKYFDIYLNQLETARTKYGFIDSSYGTVDYWMGAYENNPNISVGDGETYDSIREELKENSWVAPIITEEEFEQAVAEFDENYQSIIEAYLTEFDEAKQEYDRGEISDENWLLIKTATESINDGTFYDTVIQYFEDCRDGYYQYEGDFANRFLALALASEDTFHAYLGQYNFKFPNTVVQRNQPRTYIFDINIIATDVLHAGNYVSIPSLKWCYEESCPSMHLVSDGFPNFHWENYYPCNSRRSSFLNWGNISFTNNIDFGANDIEHKIQSDKRYLAMNFIESELDDSNYTNQFRYEYFAEAFSKVLLWAVRPVHIECLDENGSVIKSDTIEICDPYYNISADEIYDYRLVGPENAEGVLKNENTTITFYYERKDAEISVSFVDTDGNEIAPAEIIKGKTLDEYNAVPAEIPGYELVEIPENASGVFHEDSEGVQFVYVKNTYVIVNFLDINGNVIADSETITGRIDDDYTAVPKEIEGYKVIGSPNNASGKMTEAVINVFYIYLPLNY